MTAIEASSARCKTMADGTLQLTVNIEPRDAIKAFSMFSAPGTALAIAALVPEHARQAEPEPAPIKGGEIARWLGIRCGEDAFQAWLFETYWKQAAHATGDTPAKRAASVIRAVCGVESRREFDSDPDAADRFHRLIRSQWATYQQSRGEV